MDQLTSSSRLSLSTLLDLRTTIGSQGLTPMLDFNFQASVFPLYAVSDLIAVILSNRHRPELSTVIRSAEELQICLQRTSKASNLEDEFEVAPYLIFFVENSTKVIGPKSKSKRSPAQIDDFQRVKKAKKALIRLLQAIEQVSTLSKGTELLDLIQEIAQQNYLYQSKKALLEQVISAKTVAQYLLSNLPLLPEKYKENDFQRLFKETAAKASRKRIKNKRIQTLNQVVMLGERYAGIRNVEGLLMAGEGVQRGKGAIRELKGKVMEMEVPVCIKVNEGEENSHYLSVTRVDFPMPIVPLQTASIHSKKKTSNSLDPENTGKRRPEHCVTIADFVTRFTHIQIVQNATQTLSDPDKVRSCFSNYLDLVREELSRRVRKEAISEDMMEALLSEVEDHVMRAMYQDVFPTWASKEDISLHFKCRSLTALTPEDFSLPSVLDLSVPLRSFPLLDQLAIFMTPREKLLALVEFTAVILVDLDLDFEINRSEKTEETLRYLAFVIVQYEASKKNAPMLPSNLNYIFKFGTYRKPTLREAISFSLVRSAVDYIQRLHTADSAASQSRNSFSAYL